jgi:protein-S-isoprenylcysteine O-methyltransferase Ste14
MASMKVYRIEIILVFLFTSFVSIYYAIIHYSTVQDEKIIIANILVFVGFFYEMITLKEVKTAGLKDNGFISSLLFSGVLLAIVAGRYAGLFTVTDVAWNYTFAGGVGCFFVALLLRILAKQELKANFSYAIQLQEKHTLIQTGVYSFIRHPAYLGTYMFILSVMLLFGVYVGFFLIFIGIPITLKRIRKEEKLLSQYFGVAYYDYRHKVKMIIPYLF